MAEEMKIGCARPTSEVQQSTKKVEEKSIEQSTNIQEEKMIKVGKPAPDFTAPAYHQGKFINVKLSDYLGKWVVLCFYPGDFTFV